MPADTQMISVVIPTVDRGPAFVETVESVLRNDYSYFEVIIVDQSSSLDTRYRLEECINRGRVRYFTAPHEGVALSRNLGALHAGGAVIAYTDDDCEVPASWLADVAKVFDSDPTIGMMFGNVLAGPHEREKGFVQSYVRTEAYLASAGGDKHRVEGIGACMALRKYVWEEVGGFDLALGAGGTFRSAEETDLAFRVLLAGYGVYETPRVGVVHHGFRTWEERPSMIRDYLFGLGAMAAKHLQCRNWDILKLQTHLAFRWAFREPVADLGGRSSRWMRLSAYLRGWACGAVRRVDKSTGLYRSFGPLTKTVDRFENS